MPCGGLDEVQRVGEPERRRCRRASSIQVRSSRQPVPASAPTTTPSRTRSDERIGERGGHGQRLSPCDVSSTVSKTIAALRAATASAAVEPSTSSGAGTPRVRGAQQQDDAGERERREEQVAGVGGRGDRRRLDRPRGRPCSRPCRAPTRARRCRSAATRSARAAPASAPPRQSSPRRAARHVVGVVASQRAGESPRNEHDLQLVRTSHATRRGRRTRPVTARRREAVPCGCIGSPPPCDFSDGRPISAGTAGCRCRRREISSDDALAVVDPRRRGRARRRAPRSRGRAAAARGRGRSRWRSRVTRISSPSASSITAPKMMLEFASAARVDHLGRLVDLEQAEVACRR